MERRRRSLSRRIARKQRALDQFETIEIVLNAVEASEFCLALVQSLEQLKRGGPNSIVMHLLPFKEKMDSVGVAGCKIKRATTLVNVWATRVDPQKVTLPKDELASQLVDFLNLFDDTEY